MARKQDGPTRPPVCKPCWELKYCPYGALVEFFPLVQEDGETESVRVHSWDDTDSIGKFLGLHSDDWLEFLVPETRCSVFGHACPVFFTAEPLTETSEERSVSGRVPRKVMLSVARRDGMVCQICTRPVTDDMVEFDHIIPKSKGGPSTESNVRVTCRTCNRKKGTSVGVRLRNNLHDIPDAEWKAFGLLCGLANQKPPGALRKDQLAEHGFSKKDMDALVKRGWAAVTEHGDWTVNRSPGTQTP